MQKKKAKSINIAKDHLVDAKKKNDKILVLFCVGKKKFVID